jgi:predicted DNA-binding protein with PD1-like motif
MKRRQLLDRNGERIYVLVYEAGEAFQEPLVSLACENHLGASQFTAIGAFRTATIGYFDRERRDYIKLSIGEQVEVLTLNGNVTMSENSEPKIHAHVILGRRDGSVRGGHLFDGEVWPTLELLLTESPAHLKLDRCVRPSTQQDPLCYRGSTRRVVCRQWLNAQILVKPESKVADSRD